MWTLPCLLLNPDTALKGAVVLPPAFPAPPILEPRDAPASKSKESGEPQGSQKDWGEAFPPASSTLAEPFASVYLHSV